MDANRKALLSSENQDFFTPKRKERVFLRQRQHMFVLLVPLLLLVIFYFSAILSALALSMVLGKVIQIFVPLFLLSTIVALSTIVHFIIDWHFHFYILTEKRMLEARYCPLFNDRVNNIILSQVKSTEVTYESKGFFNRLFDVGNVIITFDRPTHEDEFVLYDIKNPQKTCFIIAEALDAKWSNSIINKKDPITTSPVWCKSKDNNQTFSITEEIVGTPIYGPN